MTERPLPEKPEPEPYPIFPVPYSKGEPDLNEEDSKGEPDLNEEEEEWDDEEDED